MKKPATKTKPPTPVPYYAEALPADLAQALARVNTIGQYGWKLVLIDGGNVAWFVGDDHSGVIPSKNPAPQPTASALPPNRLPE